MTVKNIGLLGLGNVGQGLWELLEKNRSHIYERTGFEFYVRKILVRDRNKQRFVPGKLITNNPKTIINDQKIDVVVEAIGGIEPAKDYVIAALKSGKGVVTANKALLSDHIDDLVQVCRENNRSLGFEASVCGGIPVIRLVKEGLSANRIELLCGILNGTTNYILTKIANDALTFEQALQLAQEKGFCERDASLDVDGIDSAQKLSILASLAFNKKIGAQKVYTQSIRTITEKDTAFAARAGYVVKQVSFAKYRQKIELRVHPCLLRKTHHLANVKDEFNGIVIRGDAVGELVFYGKGAGSLPTASALLSDVIEIARLNGKSLPFLHDGQEVSSTNDFKAQFYLRFPIFDRAGAIGLLATALGNGNISIKHAEASLDSKNPDYGDVYFVTHRFSNLAVHKVVNELRRNPLVRGEPVVLSILD